MHAQPAKATSAGKMAFDLLCPASEGIVYAIFQRTFYLKTTACFYVAQPDADTLQTHSPAAKKSAATLCCIGQYDLQQGPLNVRTSLKHIPELAVGDRWHCEQRRIVIGSTELDLSEVKIWLPPHSPQLSRPLEAGVDQLTEFLAASAQGIDRFDQHSSLPKNRVDAIANAQLSHSSMQLQQWLNSCAQTQPDIAFPVNLIGCGPGLTPAGDDILVGALLALHTWQGPQLARLIEEVTQRITTTNDISAAHLLAACSGAGIAPLHRLINAICATFTEQSEFNRQVLDAADTLGDYGHSSGYYAMKGVLIAASCHRSNS